MGIAGLWTKAMERDGALLKIAAAVASGCVGVWSFATNRPDAHTHKKSMVKSAVSVGAFIIGAALGIPRFARRSVRVAFHTAEEQIEMPGGGWQSLAPSASSSPQSSATSPATAR